MSCCTKTRRSEPVAPSRHACVELRQALSDFRRHTGPMESDPLDDALTAFAATAPEFGPFGLSNHGPMAAEVLGQLGHRDAIAAWATAYRRAPGCRAAPAEKPLSEAEWPTAPGGGGELSCMAGPLRDRAGGSARWSPSSGNGYPASFPASSARRRTASSGRPTDYVPSARPRRCPAASRWPPGWPIGPRNIRSCPGPRCSSGTRTCPRRWPIFRTCPRRHRRHS